MRDPIQEAVPPLVAHGLVHRSRLHDMLDAGIPAGATLVAAAAGWGKTVLVTSWAQGGAAGRSVAWLTLEPEDDGPQPFWRSVARALLGLGDGPHAELLRRVVVGGVAAEYLPGTVAEALDRAAAPVVLVLDNLHEITSAEVHEDLVRLVERPLPTLSIVALTRRDPPWPLQRLRLAGLVCEVRAADLAFRPAEAAELFAQLGVDLTTSQVERLVERTEGWAAGLRLAALHLQDQPDVEAAVTEFSGDVHSVAGYLLTEVLDRQSPELIRFLTQVSVVDLVSADLAGALTGRPDAGQVLADLADSHLFIRAVDRPGRWFRLHRLISDILRARRVPSRERRDLHRRAAEWFRSNGMPLEAIRSAVAGGLWPLAADLAGIHAVALVMGGRGALLERVLTKVPRTALGVHAELAASLAGARVAQGNGLDVARLLADARSACAALPARRAARAEALVWMSAGGLGRLTGDWTATEAAYRRVPVEPGPLAALGMADGEIVPVVVHNNLGVAAMWSGDPEGAERHLTAAVEADVPGVVLAQLNAGSYRALLRAERGELDLAETEALEVLTSATAAGLGDTVQVAAAHLALIQVALDRAETGDADDRLARLSELVNVGSEPHVRLAAAVLGASRRAVSGHHEAALTLLQAQLGTDGPRAPRVLTERAALIEAMLLTRSGEPDLAARRLAELGPPRTRTGRADAAFLQLRLGNVHAAEELRAGLAAAPTVRVQVQVLLLDALLAVDAGEPHRARRLCDEALLAALPLGLRSPFLVDPERLRPLLQACLEHGTAAPAFVLDLLARIDGDSGGPGPGVRPLADPPTERERTVLRYLSSSLSNAEIAAELYVSVSTVKTHERALYRKLGATSRRGAVRRARLLGLL